LAHVNREGVDCDWAWQAGAVAEILSGLSVRARGRKRRRTAANVAAVLVLGLAGAFWQWHRIASPTASRPDSSLVVVRPQTLSLPDGSVVELKEGAIVTTDFSGPTRTISLTQGTAYFHVAKDANRPFIVSAGGLAVRAVGTAFTVELADKNLTVLVTEGRVRVDDSQPAERSVSTPIAHPLVSVDAGNSVVLPITAPTAAPVVRTVAAADVWEQTGWRLPKLEFSATSLREIIEQMNQHNRRKFVLGDAAIGNLRVSGILRADKVDALTEMLEADFGVRAERDGDLIILLGSK
jgi:transmembrane sensor